jgi:hypothetical protein
MKVKMILPACGCRKSFLDDHLLRNTKFAESLFEGILSEIKPNPNNPNSTIKSIEHTI